MTGNVPHRTPAITLTADQQERLCKDLLPISPIANTELIYQRLTQTNRGAPGDDATLGVWINNCDYVDLPRGMFAFGLEDVRRDKKEFGKTRIRAGNYPLIARSHGGKATTYRERWGHEFVVEIGEVPEFSDVLVHVGNDADDTEGCILLASDAANFVSSDYEQSGVRVRPFIGRSVLAYRHAYDHVFAPLFGRRPVGMGAPRVLVRDEDYLLNLWRA